MATKSTKYYTDPSGETVPAQYVKPYDKLRDKIAQRIAKDWQDLNARLTALKLRTIEQVAQLQQAAATAEGVPELGGKEGNIQFRSFDGNITVRVDNAKRTEFDERLQLAQTLIQEAVADMATTAGNDDIIEIATKAFQPRRSGNLDMQRVRDLRNYNVKHPKWRQACEIISDCERTIGYCRYIRVSVRQDRNAQPKDIPLDIARV
jgi:hypothetical protein